MIPTVENHRSDTLTHRFGDCFNTPGLTIFLGCVQVTTVLPCLQCLNFPPLATPRTPTASFILDDFHFPTPGRPAAVTWYPDRIVRESVYQGLHLTSIVALAVEKMATVILEGIFGLHPTPTKGITARPQFGKLDPKAELLGLRYQGKRFGVNSNGIFPMN